MARAYGTFEKGNPAPRRRRRKKLSAVQKFVRGMDAIGVMALILTLYMLFFRVVVVVGPSMYDTLVDGDRVVLLSSIFYHEPKQGDIVVCSKDSFDAGNCFVKRVIATEGQTVDIDFETGQVMVDGDVLEENYIYSPTIRNEGIEFPLIVEEGHVFVLGDNRNNSTDSRSPMIGQVDVRQIVGKAIYLLYPGDNQGKEEAQFSRVGWIG